jgi:hypothetical protein
MSLIVGNVYECRDRRDHGRRVKVIRVEGRHAVCVPVGAKIGRRLNVTRIALVVIATRWRCVMFDPPQGGS